MWEKSLLVEGLGWCVGNGSSIRVWMDLWLSTLDGKRLCKPSMEHVNNHNLILHVFGLLCLDGFGWNPGKCLTFSTGPCYNPCYLLLQANRFPRKQMQ
ncbi:hypothetical protein V2J09_021490 [Rumex salicifolius]